MQHPYKNLPQTSFWRRSVVGVPQNAFDPIIGSAWQIAPGDAVATSGSCFAQHISRALAAAGFNFLVAETAGADEPGVETVYSARYGNIYTTSQLRQLFERAYGLKIPHDKSWIRPDGRHVDPFRPREFERGFSDPDEVAAAQDRHYSAVRDVFEKCRVLVFTLGLTETWICEQDGMAVPLAPHVVAAPGEGVSYGFRNLPPDTMVADLNKFIEYLTSVNPDVRVVLTVSPVPLEATYEPRHVLVSTVYSKAALRVTAEMVQQQHADRVAYFPSFEIVSGFPHNESFEDDLRTVRPEVVAHVMSVFKRHYTTADADLSHVTAAPSREKPATPPRPAINEFAGVLCDEEMLGRV